MCDEHTTRNSGASTSFAKDYRCPLPPKRFAVTSLTAAACVLFLASKYNGSMPSKSSAPQYHRRLDWTSNCKPDILSTLPSPTKPNTPFLKRPAYLASFPGSGDKLFSKYLVEMISGMQVGEAAISPSLYKLQELGTSGGYGGQGEVFGVRTHFPHTSGKLVSCNVLKNVIVV